MSLNPATDNDICPQVNEICPEATPDNIDREIYRDIDISKTATGELLLDPYNPNNIEITQDSVRAIMVAYGSPSTTIHNFELYKRAFVNKSYMRRPAYINNLHNITIAPIPPGCVTLKSKSNERLEFLGDGVLELIVKYYLYRRFPKENEGFMTEKKIAIVKNETIGKIAYEMGIHRWLLLSKHAEEKKTRTNLKKLGCLFEAFIGAMFLDFNKIVVADDQNWFNAAFATGPGFQMVQKIVENILEAHINWVELVQTDDNYKKILQNQIQKEFKITPTYKEMETYDAETGYAMGVYLCIGQPAHSVTHAHSVSVALNPSLATFDGIREYIRVNGSIFLFMGGSRHKIKRKAEQTACRAIIKMFSDP